MKRIVKIGISVAALATLAFSMTGCSSKTCDVCGKSYSSGGSTTTILGREVNVCSDCMKSATGGILG